MDLVKSQDSYGDITSYGFSAGMAGVGVTRGGGQWLG